MSAKGSAKQTINIIEQGFYIVNEEKINISEQINKSVDNTVLYTPQLFEAELQKVEAEILVRNFETVIRVENCTAMQAVDYLPEGRTGCLNFASAKNPGGGFINGAKAQEESLSRASTLYPTQTKYFHEMYEYNRSQNNYLYSDLMIYSPDVVFFKDDSEQLLTKPYQLDILTSPAVNIGAMTNNNRPDELLKAEQVMMQRTDKVLSAFVKQGVDNLILGAWGCGVFRNKPADVARYFAHYLTGDGKYAKCFKNVIFAVYDRSKNKENIQQFENVFKTQ